MKSLLMIASFVCAAVTASAAGPSFCGMGGGAMFDTNNVYNCKITLNTCETADLQAKGWAPSLNGKCPQAQPTTGICGMGITKMVNPQNPKQVIYAMNTCQSQALSDMGFVQSF
jgi:hypothetical protein